MRCAARREKKNAAERTTLLFAASVSVMAGAGAGCAHERSLVTPGQRMTDDTAYTLRKHETRVDVGAGGLDTDELVVEASVHGGVTDWLELGTNVAHLGLGIMNARAEVAPLERPKGALSIESSVAWTRSSMLWALPRKYREIPGNVDLVVVPTRLHGSWLAHPRAGVHLSAGYTHVTVQGHLERETWLADGGFGSRDVFLEPQLDVLLGRGVVWITRAHVSLWAASYQAVETRYQSQPGVVVGGTMHGWRQLPFFATHRVQTGLEGRVAERTYLRFMVHGGQYIPNLPFIVTPSLEVYWRFGADD